MRRARFSGVDLALPGRWLALALLGVAGIGWFAGLLQGQRQTVILLAALGVAGVALALLTLARPSIGLFAVAVSAGFVRVKVGTGTGTPLVASLACATLLCGCWLVHRL